MNAEKNIAVITDITGIKYQLIYKSMVIPIKNKLLLNKINLIINYYYLMLAHVFLPNIKSILLHTSL